MQRYSLLNVQNNDSKRENTYFITIDIEAEIVYKDN